MSDPSGLELGGLELDVVTLHSAQCPVEVYDYLQVSARLLPSGARLLPPGARLLPPGARLLTLTTC